MITSILLGICLLAIMPYLLKLFHIIIFLGYALYVFISCKDVRQNIIQTINHHVEQNLKMCQQNDTNSAVKSEYDYSIYEFDEEAFEFVKSKAKFSFEIICALIFFEYLLHSILLSSYLNNLC